MGRNTALLQEIITVLDSELDDTEYALDALESHFHDALLVNAGNVATISIFAEQLRPGGMLSGAGLHGRPENGWHQRRLR